MTNKFRKLQEERDRQKKEIEDIKKQLALAKVTSVLFVELFILILIYRRRQEQW